MNSLFLFAAIALMAGAAIGYLVRKVQVKAKIDSAENRAEKLLDEVRQKEKEIIISAKDQAIKITEEAKKQETENRQQILRIESRIEKKETDLDNKSTEIDKQKANLETQKEEHKKIREDLQAGQQKQVEALEKIAKLNREEAKQLLLDQTERSVSEDMIGLTRKIVSEAREEAEKKARDIVSQAIERVSAEVSSETTTTTVTIPSDEMKGRIIGKEGRNIKAFEQALGVEVIVDESPDTVVISGFNSVLRFVAKVTLEKLLKDGRIHPAKIEE